MAEIPGATIDFTDYSAPGTPRVLNIPDAVGDVVVQDLWDTLSAKAALLDNLIYKRLITRRLGGGKTTLSATKLNGITLSLNNVQVKFFDQPGPGFVIKRVVDGNLVARDDLDVQLEPLATSDFTNWKNEADVSAALINEALLVLLIEEIHKIHGLDAANKLDITDTSRVAGAVTQTISDVAGTTTVQRT